MKAFLYGVSLQWKMDIRSKTLLITCYIVPLLFFAVMGGIFTSVMPDSKDTLIQSMTVFGVTMGALIGLPPSLVEIYGSNIKKVYKANGVPICLGLVLTNISTFIHLLIMGTILYITAPLAFDAKIPSNSGIYFISLITFTAVSLSVASILGLAVVDQAKISMFSMIIFLPSIMLSGIMFPAELLPEAFRVTGKLFPAWWGYRMMLENRFEIKNILPLVLIFLFAIVICCMLLKKTDQ
ncbi:ABC transporter permease [Mediterraneibacter gnavus]|uniref:ABC transporter permease n=1 Tax=Mediterraneibacter gnavus TaxID=33038 RepID=UPI0004639AD6|nr:ABC transporter permease [Mediterraneibacter gnavus]MDB8710019.1 ABC transporter permease [Mediterraneibacter gnavus]MDB8712813.1 ABC transporter permease [Mediterraneibacter gnavus]